MTDKVEEAALRRTYNCDQMPDEAVGKAYRDLSQAGNHIDAANLLIGHILRRPVHTNPQTYADRGKDL